MVGVGEQCQVPREQQVVLQFAGGSIAMEQTRASSASLLRPQPSARFAATDEDERRSCAVRP